MIIEHAALTNLCEYRFVVGYRGTLGAWRLLLWYPSVEYDEDHHGQAAVAIATLLIAPALSVLASVLYGIVRRLPEDGSADLVIPMDYGGTILGAAAHPSTVPALDLLTGEPGHLARTRMYLPGTPAAWSSSARLTAAGLAGCQDVARVLAVALHSAAAPWLPRPMVVRTKYPAGPNALLPVLHAAPAVSYRVLWHTEDAPAVGL